MHRAVPSIATGDQGASRRRPMNWRTIGPDEAAPAYAFARRRRAHHPDPRAQGARGRDQGAEGQARPHQPHEVPGDRAPHARGARPREGRPRPGRLGARRAAQAARRHRADPGQDGRARHEPHRPARARCVDLHGRAAVPPRLAARVRCGAQPRRADHHARGRGQARARREPGHPGVRALSSARQPVPRPRLLEGARPGRARAPPRELGAARAAVQVVRDRLRRPGGQHGPPRGAHRRPARPARTRAHEAPGPVHRVRPRSATAPSCSPTSPGSARPRSRCSRHPSPTPTRCSRSCRTS